MKATYFTILLSLALVSGCAQSYTVYVNGFAEAPKAIPENARIYVTTEAASSNPIFDKEIKAKIVKSLASRGYTPVDDVKAEYRLTFHFGESSHREEYYEYVGAGTGPHEIASGLGTIHYIPTMRTVWDQWLQMKVYRGDSVVWVGEAETSRRYADKRQAVDYLIVGALEFLGRDTVKQQKITIDKKDARIASLGS